MKTHKTAYVSLLSILFLMLFAFPYQAVANSQQDTEVTTPFNEEFNFFNYDDRYTYRSEKGHIYEIRRLQEMAEAYKQRELQRISAFSATKGSSAVQEPSLPPPPFLTSDESKPGCGTVFNPECDTKRTIQETVWKQLNERLSQEEAEIFYTVVIPCETGNQWDPSLEFWGSPKPPATGLYQFWSRGNTPEWILENNPGYPHWKSQTDAALDWFFALQDAGRTGWEYWECAPSHLKH